MLKQILENYNEWRCRGLHIRKAYVNIWENIKSINDELRPTIYNGWRIKVE